MALQLLLPSIRDWYRFIQFFVIVLCLFSRTSKLDLGLPASPWGSTCRCCLLAPVPVPMFLSPPSRFHALDALAGCEFASSVKFSESSATARVATPALVLGLSCLFITLVVKACRGSLLFLALDLSPPFRACAFGRVPMRPLRCVAWGLHVLRLQLHFLHCLGDIERCSLPLHAWSCVDATAFSTLVLGLAANSQAFVGLRLQHRAVRGAQVVACLCCGALKVGTNRLTAGPSLGSLVRRLAWLLPELMKWSVLLPHCVGCWPLLLDTPSSGALCQQQHVASKRLGRLGLRRATPMATISSM